METKKVKLLSEQVENEFLPFVRRPSRYIGGEVNQVKKELVNCQLKVALCFPDVYEIGMSHTGLAIIYDILNKIDDIAAERVFAPWTDAEEIMRTKNIPLFSLESKADLKSFDVVGFSLTNELCYTNALNMLDLAGIEIYSNKRSENDPLIIGGGGMANCCEPIADFFDLFILGEGENAIVELVELFKFVKEKSKKEILTEISQRFTWAYVPAIYNLKLRTQNSKLKNAVVEDFENAPIPVAPIVPFAQAVHERISIEIMRGCPGRCRFCQASFTRRPVRYRSIDRIVELAKQCYQSTGLDTVSLLSLSTADYPELEELVSKLQEHFQDKHVGLSLPSLKVNQQLALVPNLANFVRKSGLTIAVEAASEDLRKIINKPLKDEDLFTAVEAAYKAGWQKLKLYFMVGLPGETEDDVKNIVSLSIQLAKLRKKVDNKTAQINAAVSWFVPKAHTPFAWVQQKSIDYFANAKKMILEEKRKLNARFIQFKFHNIERSILESVIGRGDRQLSRVIETAWQKGAKFDLWDECFDYKIWQDALSEFGLDIETEAQKKFEIDQTLPWDYLGGPDKDYLLKYFNDANRKIKD